MKLIVGEFDHAPPSLSFEPLPAGRYWLLLAWMPYRILNIPGEKFLWRGVMRPRQEACFRETCLADPRTGLGSVSCDLRMASIVHAGPTAG